MDLRAELPFELPEGGFVAVGEQEPLDDGTSPLWVSREAPSPGTWAQARRAHGETGWWPLLLRLPDHLEEGSSWDDTELFFPDDVEGDTPDVAKLLERHWADYTTCDPKTDMLSRRQREVITAPFGTAWPGLAPGGRFEAGDADDVAERCATELAAGPGTRLGLVRAASGAAAVDVLGWDGPVNYGLDPGDTATILANWERRFGTRVLMVHGATLVLSTATVPGDREQALRLAAEHFAFCPDNVWQGTVHTLEEYAQGLVGRETWSFWWD